MRLRQSVLLLLILFVLTPGYAQINLSSGGNFGFATSSDYDHKFYFLNNSEDRGLMFKTTKQSGGTMRGIINEMRQTQYSSVLYGFVNDIDKYSGDTKTLLGFHNRMVHRGSGWNLGLYNYMDSEGTGEKRALYNNVQDNHSGNSTTDKPMFGVYNYIHSVYRKMSYGSFTHLENSNTDANDKMYGVYVEDGGSGNAMVYGIYSSIPDTVNNFAGYFEGKVHVDGPFSYSSDRKLKKNIKKLDGALEIVNSLTPSSYYYDATSGHGYNSSQKHYGFVAQELEEILPDLVTTIVRPAKYKFRNDIDIPEDGEESSTPQKLSEEESYKGVRYNDLIAILVQALKEEDIKVKGQDKKIKEEKEKTDQLKLKVADLEKTVQLLTKRLELLEKM